MWLKIIFKRIVFQEIKITWNSNINALNKNVLEHNHTALSVAAFALQWQLSSCNRDGIWHSHYFSLLLNALQIIVTLITQQCLLYHAILLICCYQYIFIMSKQQKKRNVNFKCCVFKAPWSVDYFKFSGTITHLHCVIMQ